MSNMSKVASATLLVVGAFAAGYIFQTPNVETQAPWVECVTSGGDSGLAVEHLLPTPVSVEFERIDGGTQEFEVDDSSPYVYIVTGITEDCLPTIPDPEG